MDLAKLCEFFGGSLLADDYRANFEHISAFTDGPSVTGTPRSQNAAMDAPLCEAVYWTLAGNHKKARLALQTSRRAADVVDERLKSRIHTYEQFSFVDRLHPPAIRFRSPFGGSAVVIFEAQNFELAAAVTSIRSRHGTLDQLEASMPLQIYLYNIYLEHKQYQHPLHAQPELGAASAHVLEQMTAFPSEYVESMAVKRPRFMAGSLKRLEYEANTASVSGLQQSDLEAMLAFFDGTQDLVGEALCLLGAGDKLLSPSFTSPLALNLVVEGRFTGMVDEVWDLQEPKFRLHIQPQADAYYQEAFQLMEAAGSSRGCAAISLRRAAVLHMTSIYRATSPQNLATQLAEADSLLKEARRGFGGDEANTCLVDAHQILLDISRSRLDPAAPMLTQQVADRAAAIGRWGREAENTMLTQFCGLLMLRLGRRMLLDHNYLDIALLCAQCAKAVFESSEDQIFHLQALLAEADLVHASGGFAQAEIILREAIEMLNQVLSLLDTLGDSSATTKQKLQAPIVNMLLYFDRIASRVLTSAAETQALHRWRGKYSELQVKQASLTHVFETGTGASSTSQQGGIAAVQSAVNQAQRLAASYNTAYEAAYEELQKGNIEGFDAHLGRFLASDQDIPAPRDQTAMFRIMASSSLGLTSAAALELPYAVPNYLGEGVDPMRQLLQQISLQGPTLSLHRQMERQSATRAIAVCFLSQDWSAGLKALQKASGNVQGFLTLDDPTARGIDWQLDSWIAAIYEHSGLLDKAMAWYLHALHDLENFRSRNAHAAARSGSGWSIHGPELFSGLVRTSLAYAKQSPSQPPEAWHLPATTWIDQTLMFSERSSARTLLEFLIQKQEEAGSTEVSSDLLRDRAEYLFLQRQIADLGTLPDPRAQKEHVQQRIVERRKFELAQLKEQLKALEQGQPRVAELSHSVEAMVAASSYSASTDKLFAAIPPDAMVLEINMSRSGIVVFCITRSGIQKIHQSTMSSIQMRRRLLQYVTEVGKYQNALQKRANGDNGPLAACATTDELNMRAAGISDEIIAPFAKLLEDKDHIIFVPTQEFNVFPLSALTYEDKPIFLSKAVSSVPNLSVLAQLTSRPPPTGPSTTPFTAIYNTHEPPPPARPTSSTVPMVGVTALLTSSLYATHPTPATALSPSAFEAAYSQSRILLISTHGHRSPYSPWQSYIRLATDFRVMELSQFRTDAALVVFGACLSAAGRVTASNDVYGFSHAVLQSGAQAYIGALWSVSDIMTMLLLLVFFQKLKPSGPGQRTSLAQNWAQAHRVVYGLDTEAAVAMLEEIREEVLALRAAGVDMAPLGRLGFIALNNAIKDLPWMKINFKHPYYWGAFGIVGNGGQATANKHADPPKSRLDITALKGHQLGEDGHIFGDKGRIIGTLIAGSATECRDRSPDISGNILNESGIVIGKVQVVKSDGFAEWVDGDDSDATSEEQKYLHHLYHALTDGVGNLLAQYNFSGELNDVAVQLDTAHLRLKHWIDDITVKGIFESVLPLIQHQHPYAVKAYRFVMVDVLQNTRRLEKLLSEADPLYNSQIQGLSSRIERGVQLLTEETEFCRDMMNLHYPGRQSEIRTLRSQMEEVELTKHTKEKPPSDPLPLWPGPEDEESAVAETLKDAGGNVVKVEDFMKRLTQNNEIRDRYLVRPQGGE